MAERADWRWSLWLVASISVGGCAINQEGVKFKQPLPTPEQAAQNLAQLKENAKGLEIDRLGVIVVGNLSAFRSIAPDEEDDEYKEYVEAADAIHPRQPPDLTREEFSAQFGGWTMLVYKAVPLMLSWYTPAYVPREMIGSLGFSSSAETILFQGTGDLVAGVSNSDFMLVVFKLLCKEGPGYAECASAYAKGIFDLNTGQTLDHGKPKLGGPQIDPKTFKRVGSQAPE